MTFDKADLEVSRFDAAEYLDSPEAQAEYLAAAFETGDADYIKQALSTLSRARGMTVLADDADVTAKGCTRPCPRTATRACQRSLV